MAIFKLRLPPKPKYW